MTLCKILVILYWFARFIADIILLIDTLSDGRLASDQAEFHIVTKLNLFV